jgi:hypothetical protein
VSNSGVPSAIHSYATSWCPDNPNHLYSAFTESSRYSEQLDEG